MTLLPKIIAAITAGKPIIIFDDNPNREFEGDIVVAAEKITNEQVNFMAHVCGGLICVAASAKILDQLEIPPMLTNSNDPLKTNWAISVDHKHSGTGISAADRALTIRQLANQNSLPHDFIKPGHIFPLRAHTGGLDARRGHTESAVALMQFAGLSPVAAICEIMLENGKMLRLEDLEHFSQKYNILHCTISDIVAYQNKIIN
jgi:3,4-dihydroxy-2-butanone 4-phosphate synthase